MLSPEIKLFDNPDQVAEAFAEELFALVSNSPGVFHLALSGGSTPKLLFDLLAREYQSKMPWGKIHFWWGDERCVPPADNESNYKMTHEHLLMKVPVDDRQVHRIQGELEPGKACELYIREILTQVNQRRGLPAFDLIMLGMGNDGHTASIFPDQMDLLETDRICETAIHPQSGQIRVSLTGRVMNNAERVFFLVTGKAKAERIKQIVNGDEMAVTLPVYHIRPLTGKLVFYIDRDAASGI
ncbi:MAG: 6-phosphogluconolactonase [Prolixibacteraceae bacterium]